MKKVIILFGILATVLSQTGFGFVRSPAKTEIAAVTQRPAKYAGRRLTLEGRVVGSISILGIHACVLQDKDGVTMDVIGFVTPGKPGKRMIVTGQVRFAEAMGDTKVPVLIVGLEELLLRQTHVAWLNATLQQKLLAVRKTLWLPVG